MNLSDFSVMIGIIIGLSLPGITGLIFIVKMENRVTTLENADIYDKNWKERMDTKLDGIARDVNQLIGGRKSND